MKTRVTGHATFRSFDFMCPECEYVENRTFDLRVEIAETTIKCPNCEKEMERVWLKAPMTRVGGGNSDRSVDAMKKSFRERFVKKEMADVQHKHGKLFGDSIQSAAAQRIKKGEKPE